MNNLVLWAIIQFQNIDVQRFIEIFKKVNP